MGTMVLAVFGYFGLSTAIDSKALKAEAEALIGELKTLKRRVENTRQAISNEALVAMSPKLGAIADYGMTIANFAMQN